MSVISAIEKIPVGQSISIFNTWLISIKPSHILDLDLIQVMPVCRMAPNHYLDSFDLPLMWFVEKKLNAFFMENIPDIEKRFL